MAAKWGATPYSYCRLKYVSFVKAGDHVLITHDCSKICLGDIVVFRRNDALFAHRVVKILKTGTEFACITRGDNATLCDLPVNGQEIMGRVLAISRETGRLGVGISWRMAGRFVVFYTGIGMWLGNRGYSMPKDLLRKVHLVLFRLFKEVYASCFFYTHRYVGYSVVEMFPGLLTDFH